jgi:tetratricopeptide (TPR) repeat protein
MIRHALLVFALLFVAASAEAGNTLRLKDGSRVSGQAIAYDGDAQVLTFRTDEGRVLEISIDDLDGRSSYQLNRSLIEKTNGPAQLALANFARDVGLFAHSSRHYDQAEEADPSLAAEVARQRALMHTAAAEWVLATAKEAIAKGDNATAEKWLTKLVEKLPNHPLTTEAADLLEEQYTTVHSAKDDHLEDQYADVLNNQLKQGKKHYDRMLDMTKQGLTSKRTGSAAMKAWDRAIYEGKKCFKELDDFEKDEDNSEAGALASEYRALVTEHMVSVYMHMASNSMTRTDYNGALSHVNQAIALDPANTTALNMRTRVEVASSDSGGWIGGRR